LITQGNAWGAGGMSDPDRLIWSMIELEKLDENEVWDLFLEDADSQAARGEAVSLDYYLDRVPRLADHGSALHAAISAVLENAVALGYDRDEIIESLEANYPDHRHAIREVRVVDDMIGSTGTLANSILGPPLELPADLGPQWRPGVRRYQLIEALSRGAHGTVYLAKDRSLSEPDRPALVAIKILRHREDLDSGAALREGARARMIEHESVARVIEAGIDDRGHLYFSFEYIDGPTLESFARDHRGRLSDREAVRFLLPVLRGLAGAHERGVAHLDLHPRNVLVRRTGSPVLIDFGMGAVIHDLPGPLGRPPGALGFICPELFRADASVDPIKADAYSAAALVWWLLTGHAPNGDTVEHIEARLSDEARGAAGLVRHGVSTDADLVSILERALCPCPSRRTRSVAALVADLEDWLAHRPIRGTRPGPWKRARLLIKRSPRTVLWTSALIATLTATGVLATWQQLGHRHRTQLSETSSQLREAELREQAAAAEAESLRTEARRVQEMRRGLEALRMLVASADQETTLTGEWFIALTLIRDLADQDSAVEGAALSQTYAARIDHARRMVAEFERTGREHSAMGLMWRAALACSLADDNRLDECADVLDGRIPAFISMFGADEPMVRRIAMLRDSATILSSRAAASSESDEAAEILRAANRLRTVDANSLPPRLARLVQRATQ